LTLRVLIKSDIFARCPVIQAVARRSLVRSDGGR